MANQLLADRFDTTDASFAFDIETSPNQEVIDRLFERKEFIDPPYEPAELKLGNAKKPETIQRLRDEHAASEAKRQTDYASGAARNERVRAHEEAENARRDEFVQASLVRAERAKVLCISYQDACDTPYVDWGSSERELLLDLWDRCHEAQKKGGTIFTASGSQFDLRMCWRRSLILGLKIPCQTINWYRGRGYPDESFVDVSEVWAAGEYGNRIKVDHLAAGFGIDGKDGNHGATFWRLAQEDREKAEAYAKRDAAIAWELGQKIRNAGIVLRRNQYSESYK